MARFTDISTNLNTRNSDLVLSTDEDAINNSIDNILRVGKTELPGRPEFGSALENFLFEPMDSLTERLIEEAIYDAIIEYEPRINIQNIMFESFTSNNVIRIIIEYVLREDKNKEIRSYTTTLNTL